MAIRWDFGKIYKKIRESKGLTQAEICGDTLSRTALAKIESGQTVPKYENMMFLLEQINMSNEEFEYICNYYQPSRRQKIFNKIYNYISTSGTDELKEIKVLCEDYLKTHHDIPVEKILDQVIVAINVRENGFLKPNKELQDITKKIWAYLEKQDTWYERDIKILNVILFNFPLETLKETTEKILLSLEKYPDYYPLRNTKMSILLNLSSIFLHNGDKEECYRLTQLVYQIAKENKRYDRMAYSYVRMGICKNDDKLIDKGVKLLQAIDEQELLTNCYEEIERLKPDYVIK